MKRFFIFLVALVSALTSFSQTNLKDGVGLVIGSFSVKEETKSAITSASPDSHIQSGTISYDSDNHILTLDNVVLEGDHSNREIFVNAGVSNDYDVTILLIGKNVIKANKGRGIWLQHINKNHRFYITGDENASLEIYAENTTAAALDVARSNGTPTVPDNEYYHNLKIEGGCKVCVYAGKGNAVCCYDFNSDNAEVCAYSASGKALDYHYGSVHYNSKVVLSSANVYAVARELYPVSLFDVPLSTLFPSFSSEIPFLSSLKGSISYDPSTRTVTLDNLDIEDNSSPEFEVNDPNDKTTPITIVTKGANTIKTSGTYHMKIGGTVVMTNNNASSDLNYLKITSTATSGTALDLYEKSTFTLQDNACLMIDSKDYGITGTESDGVYPKLTVNNSTLSVVADGGDISGIDLELVDAYQSKPLESVAKWNATKHMLDMGGSPYKELATFSPKNLFANAQVGIGHGSVSISYKGSDMGTSVKLENKDEEVTFKAVPENGWRFVGWKKMMEDKYYESKDAEYTTTLAYSLTLIAVFYKNNTSSVPWYGLNASGYIMKKIAPDFSSQENYFSMGTFPTIISEIQHYTTVGTGQYFTYFHLDGSQIGMFTFFYNTSKDEVGSPMVMRKYQTTITNPTAMTISLADKQKFYFTASDGSKYYLYESAFDAGSSPMGTQVCEIDKTVCDPSKYDWNIFGLAADPRGVLYAVARDPETLVAGLYLLDKSTGKMTRLITSVKKTQVRPNESHLKFDIETGDLIWAHTEDGTTTYIDQFILPTKDQPGEWVRLGEVKDSYEGFFQMLPMAQEIKVTIKSGQEEMGKVSLDGGYSSGTYFDGRKLTLVAEPEPGCKFVQWSDGSTDAVHEITVGSETTYTAEFAWEDGVTAYPIWVGGKQMHSKRLMMNNANNDAIAANGGSITYDPETKTITMNKFRIETSLAPCIMMGEEEHETEFTIRIKDDCNLLGTSNCHAFSFVNTNVKILGSGALSVNVSGFGAGVYLYKGELIFEGLSSSLISGYIGIKGDTKAQVKAIGCDMQINSSHISAEDIDFTMDYCEISYPSTATFDESEHTFKDGSTICNYITLKPWPTLRVDPVEDETGTFTLTDGTNTFENVGWFTSGTEVTITPTPASDYSFAYWRDDPEWNTDKHMEMTRQYTMTSSNKKMEARFHYNAKSSRTWYGVNDGKFISFNLSDGALEVQKASTPSASNVKAGDYMSGDWVYLDGNKIVSDSYSDWSDGEEMPSSTTELGTTTVGVTDMTFDHNGTMYAVAGTKLYRLNEGDKKLDEVGSFLYNSAFKTVIAIAADAKGTMYALGAGDPGVLYIVANIDEENKKVELEPADGEKGVLDTYVSTNAQALAFDHVTGELLWGAPDYMRIIDLESLKSRVVGSLNWNRSGTQGEVKALQCKDRKVTVKAAVEGESEGCTATVNGKDKAAVFVGTKVTLAATAGDDYTFRYWTKGSDEDTHYEEATFTTNASSTTWYAHFKKKEQGLESVQPSAISIQKVLRDGQLYILYNETMYNVQGQKVK